MKNLAAHQGGCPIKELEKGKKTSASFFGEISVLLSRITFRLTSKFKHSLPLLFIFAYYGTHNFTKVETITVSYAYASLMVNSQCFNFQKTLTQPIYLLGLLENTSHLPLYCVGQYMNYENS